MKMKTIASILLAALSVALPCCTNPALKINTPAVQAQIIGDVEKDIFAGGGALLISGGNTGAAVAALTAQEMRNLPALQQVLNQAAAPPAPKNPAVAVQP